MRCVHTYSTNYSETSLIPPPWDREIGRSTEVFGIERSLPICEPLLGLNSVAGLGSVAALQST